MSPWRRWMVRRRLHSRRRPSPNPSHPRRHRRPILYCHRYRHPCPPSRPDTPFRTKSSTCSWPPTGGTSRRLPSFVEGKCGGQGSWRRSSHGTTSLFYEEEEEEEEEGEMREGVVAILARSFPPRKVAPG